jgi:hypothetical protein
MANPVPRAALVAMLALGCSDADVYVTPHAAPAAVPAVRSQLGVESEEPLSFGALLSTGEALLASDRSTNDIWALEAAGGSMQLRRVLRWDARVEARLVAISSTGEEWRLLDRSGGVHIFDREDWSFRGSRPPQHGPGAIVSAAPDGEGGFALLVRRRPSRAGDVVPVFALVLLRADGTAHHAWVGSDGTGVRRGASSIYSLSRSADGWLLATTEPPRLLHFDADGTLKSEQPFISVAGRRVSPEITAQFERMAEAAGLSGAVSAPRYYPAFTAVRQVGDALLAVPYVGGSTGEAQGLDVYCGLRYARTVLDSPDVLQVLLAEHAVVAVSQTGPLSFTVDVYRPSDLPLSCEEYR